MARHSLICWPCDSTSTGDRLSDSRFENISAQAIPMQTKTRRMLLRSLLATSAASIYAGFPSEAMAGEGCCSHCGCSANRCKKICRLVQEDRKITTTCWGMQCEDFCVPGPSTPDCKQCDTVCHSEAGDKVCSQPRRIVWTSWIPGCDQQIFTKRKLMKKTITKTVPSFKWVVEDLCPKCTASCERVSLPEGTPEPPRPAISGLTFVAAAEYTPRGQD